LLRVALNLCRDWADRRRMAIGLPDDLEAVSTCAEGGEEILEALSDGELAARLRACIDQLPPMYRAVITLRYTEELSYREIADALDLPLNTVRTHLRRARARLQALLVESNSETDD
jgi:RNA polymerase sigma-70 factor (ECF subfamily)